MEVDGDIAEELSNFLTIDGRLPLGLPTSPTIANALYHGIDLDLDEVATKIGAIYSRYADDLTFSSNKKLPNILDVSNVLKNMDSISQKTKRDTVSADKVTT